MQTTHLNKQLTQERKPLLYPEFRRSISYTPCTRVSTMAGILELLKSLSERHHHSALVQRLEITSFSVDPKWDSLIIKAIQSCTNLRTFVIGENVLFDERLLSTLTDLQLNATQFSFRVYPLKTANVADNIKSQCRDWLPGQNLVKFAINITQHLSDILPLSVILNDSSSTLTNLSINVAYESVFSEYSNSPQKRRNYLLKDLLHHTAPMMFVRHLSLKGLVMTPADISLLLNIFDFSKIVSLEWAVVYVCDSRVQGIKETEEKEVLYLFSQMRSLRHLLLESKNMADLSVFSRILASIKPLEILKLMLPDSHAKSVNLHSTYKKVIVNIAKHHHNTLRVLAIHGCKLEASTPSNLKACSQLEYLQLPPMQHISDISWIRSLHSLSYLAISLRIVGATLVQPPTYMFGEFERQKGYVLQIVAYQPNLRFIKTEELILEHHRFSNASFLIPRKGLEEWFMEKGNFMSL